MRNNNILSLSINNNQIILSDLLNCNEKLSENGFNLSEKDGLILLEKMTISAQDNGRIELNGKIVKKLINEFADSSYLTQDNFISTIYDLIEIFYYYKNETCDIISDNDLIETMKNLFENQCEGSIELLQNKELDSISHFIKYGFEYKSYHEEKEDD